jgi:hypothetical protein
MELPDRWILFHVRTWLVKSSPEAPQNGLPAGLPLSRLGGRPQKAAPIPSLPYANRMARLGQTDPYFLKRKYARVQAAPNSASSIIAEAPNPASY